MLYQDRIYGNIEIREPLILELIKSRSLRRLKGIDQAGYLPLYLKVHSVSAGSRVVTLAQITRFEHSLGTFILLKKFNAPIEEQIAGLIHDVSHSAFSHTIDYVVGKDSGRTQNHQDSILERFIKKSEIPRILKKYRVGLGYILNKDNFPLLEKELPGLCADRIDYSLRNAVWCKMIKKGDVNYFLNNLYIEKNRWIFKNYQSAKRYTKLFLKLNTIYYAGFPTAVMFKTVGDLLKYALKKGHIKKDDLFTTDREVMAKIKKRLNVDKKLKVLFDRVEGKVKFQNNPKDYNARVFCKSRVVDPLFKTNKKVKRLSKIDKNWRKIVREESKPKEYFLKFGA